MLYQNTIQSLEKYVAKYPEKEIIDLLTLVKSHDKIIERENRSGHITVSGLVLYHNSLLLIFHKKLQRYLQPGGHLEGGSTLIQAAQREVLEETGIHTIPYTSEDTDLVVPIHIDIHTIPYSEKKNEPEHFHYDMMFLLIAQNTTINLQESEVSGYKWVDLNSPFEDTGIKNAVNKIRELHIQS